MRHERLAAAAIGAALLVITPGAVWAQSAPDTVEDAAVAACDGDTSAELGVVLPYLGFEMDFQSATLDTDNGWVLLELLITNATGRGDLRGSGLGMQYVEWEGATFPADFSSWLSMPADLPVRATMDAGPFPEGFSLCDAVLHFGRPTEHQSMLPLVAGAQPVYATPYETKFAKKKHTRNKKKLAQATLRRATVFPAHCTPGGWGDAAGTDAAGIVLSVDQKLKTSGFWHSATLVDPQGEEWSDNNGSDWVGGAGKRPREFCFNVAAPVGGKYKLRLDYGTGGIQIPFALPEVDFYVTEADADDVAPADDTVPDDAADDDWDGDGDDTEGEGEGEPSGIEA